MMKKNELTLSGVLLEHVIYLVFWVTVLLLPVVMLGSFEHLRWQRLVLEWIRIFPFIVLFLLHNYVLFPNLFLKGRRCFYGISILGSLALMLGLFPLCREFQHILLPLEPPRKLEGVLLSHSIPFFQIRHFADKLVFGLLIVGFNAVLKNYFVQQELLHQEESRSRELLQSELNFLKNQISPHFFMNTLNNIHALIDYDPDAAKETVISLSRLMRHILYDSRSDRIPLSKEFQFVRSYVELMRLKTSEKVSVVCELPASAPDKSVPPLLFTSLIENAFKHGVSLLGKSYISIVFSFPDEHHLQCCVTNSNHASVTTGCSGIGLENTYRRLELEFPSQYSMDIRKDEQEYQVTLTIPV